MKKLLFIMVITVVLSACSDGAEEPAPVSTPTHDTSTAPPAGKETASAKQAAAPKPADRVDKSRPFCGSRMSIEEACSKATVIISARALTLPQFEVEHEIGVINSSGQEFEIVRVLKDNLDAKNIEVNYVYVQPWRERRVEKGEDVYCFIKKKMIKQGKGEGSPPRITYTDVMVYEAIKIVLSSPDIQEKVEKILQQSRTQPSNAEPGVKLQEEDKIPVEALVVALGKFLPKNWDIVENSHGQVEPVHWLVGNGWLIRMQRRGYKPIDWKKGKGGDVRVWIMDKGYTPKGDKYPNVRGRPGAGPQVASAQEVDLWHGRRVLIWGGAIDWKTWRDDVLSALRATTESLTTPVPSEEKQK